MSSRHISSDKHRVHKIRAPSKSVVTQVDTKTRKQSLNTSHSRDLPRKKLHDTSRATTQNEKKKQDGLPNGKSKHEHDINRKNHSSSGVVYRKSSGTKLAKHQAKPRDLRENTTKEYSEKIVLKKRKKRSAFGSLPVLQKIPSEEKYNATLKHSFSWPSLQSEGFNFFTRFTEDFTKKCAVLTMGKKIHQSPNVREKSNCNEREHRDINQNERYTKQHRERTPDKAKTMRKHSKERFPNNRPKPPSWQNFTKVAEDVTLDNERARIDISSVERPNMKMKVRRGEGTDKRLRSNIHRTHSMVIDASEMPEASNLVITLAESKPHEFRLRGNTDFDDIMYMAENEQRCRDWLKTLENAEYKHHPTTAEDEPDRILSNSDTVTCDLELAEDRWDFLISPYPKGKRNSSL